MSFRRTIAFHGFADESIPLQTAKDFEAAMTKAGVRCKPHIYGGQPHGFINYGRRNRCVFEELFALDTPFESLCRLKGSPRLTMATMAP